MCILVINAGSSSVKFGLFAFDSLDLIAEGLVDWAGSDRQATMTLTPRQGEPVRRELEVSDYRAAVAAGLKVLGDSGCLDHAASIRVVGHRVVHGGEEISRPVRIDAAAKATIARYSDVAPLHNPASLEAIEAAEAALPGVPQVGVFDTAFFAHIPPAAYLYPVPFEWYKSWRIRRYGFHGTSHAYCTERAAEMLARPVDKLRLVTCHLGQGGSATAVLNGVAVTNTMGFTPLEGFMMGTRSGTVDPGILIYVQREHGISVDQLDEILQKKSGLLGISGISSDFRQVETAAAAGHQRAQLALDIYAYRVKIMIGALTVALNGLDALVFTGGIGENSSWLRGAVCDGLQCLGVHLDAARNASAQPDVDLSVPGSPVRVLAIHTREDWMIARESRRLVLESA